MLKDYEERLRKRLLSVLRQNGEELTLYYDTYGYTPIQPLLTYLRGLKGCGSVTREEIRQVVDADPQQRIEWDGGELIRATYGFMPGPKKVGEEVEPPERLYYGTHRRLLGQVLEGGLLPIASDTVQLAATPQAIGEEAGTLAICEVKARDAWQRGIRFFQGAWPYYYAEAIPAVYVSEPVLRSRG